MEMAAKVEGLSQEMQDEIVDRIRSGESAKTAVQRFIGKQPRQPSKTVLAQVASHLAAVAKLREKVIRLPASLLQQHSETFHQSIMVLQELLRKARPTPKETFEWPDESEDTEDS